MTCLIFPSFDPDKQFVGGAVFAWPLPASVVPATSAASDRQARAIPARAPALLLPFTPSPPSSGNGLCGPASPFGAGFCTFPGRFVGRTPSQGATNCVDSAGGSS